MGEEKIIAYKRGTGVYKVGYKIVKIFRKYRSEGGKVKNQRLFTKISREFWQLIINEMVVNNMEFSLKHRMGTIRIVKAKKKLKLKDGKLDTSHIYPDWKSTKLLWMENSKAMENKKIIWHLNEHTEGCYFAFRWDKATAMVKNKTLYTFIPSRVNKKNLVNAIINDNRTDFYGYKKKNTGYGSSKRQFRQENNIME